MTTIIRKISLIPPINEEISDYLIELGPEQYLNSRANSHIARDQIELSEFVLNSSYGPFVTTA